MREIHSSIVQEEAAKASLPYFYVSPANTLYFVSDSPYPETKGKYVYSFSTHTLAQLTTATVVPGIYRQYSLENTSVSFKQPEYPLREEQYHMFYHKGYYYIPVVGNIYMVYSNIRRDIEFCKVNNIKEIKASKEFFYINTLTIKLA